jgi:hypothetical protein
MVQRILHGKLTADGVAQLSDAAQRRSYGRRCGGAQVSAVSVHAAELTLALAHRQRRRDHRGQGGAQTYNV